jgi:hypothetical protein
MKSDKMLLVLNLFKAFPEKPNQIFRAEKNIKVDGSGSLGIYIDGKCVQTYPNSTLNANSRMDWCSNLGKDNNKPFITYSIQNNQMKISGYSVRTGCCDYYYEVCCSDDDHVFDDGLCCCRLYSYSLQGSNDNITWKVLHKVEKDNDFYYCQDRTFEFALTEPFKYIRFVQDEKYPGCEYCMCLNQLELYGSVTGYEDYEESEDLEADDSISIIGKVKREQSV